MMEITLTQNNIQKVRTLLSCVPSGFRSVPLKFMRKDNHCIATIETMTANFSVGFSSMVMLEDIPELITELTIKLPLSKMVMTQILTEDFNSITVSEIKMIAENSKKSLSVNMLVMGADDYQELPYTNTEMYENAVSDDIDVQGDHILMDLSNDDIKELVNCWNMLRTADKPKITIKVKANNKGITISSKDHIETSFSYLIENSEADGKIIDGVYDKNLLDIFEKLGRCKLTDKISVVVSEPIMCFTVYGSDYVCSWFVPAKE